MQQDRQLVAKMLASWGLETAMFKRVTSGHINETYFVRSTDGRYVLQRLSPIFGPEINLDIDAITIHLASAGLTTPRPVRTNDGQLWASDPEDRVWRMLTYIPGVVLERADDPARCYGAGQLLGRFHQALWDFDYTFQHRRLGVHDTERHLERLQEALQEHSGHQLIDQIEPVAHQILEIASGLKLPEGLPERIVHGDPKISNVVFGFHGEAICLVDLDTLARMPIPVELGDALRSWCCPHGEEAEGPLDMSYYFGALKGYAQTIGNLPTPPEREAIPAAVAVIAYELAARFCTDALEESYFGWDPARFRSAAEHNLIRARSQLALARSVRERLSEMESLIGKLWPLG